MNQQADAEWAQVNNTDALGLDLQDLGHDDFTEFLNDDFLETPFANFNELDHSNNTNNHNDVTQPPFGASLVQPNSQDGFETSPQQFFMQESRPPTSGPTSSAQYFVQPQMGHVNSFSQGQFVQPGPATFDQIPRGALPTPNSSEMYAKNFGYLHQQQQQQQARQQQQQRMQQTYQQRPLDLNTFTPFESPGIDGAQSAVSYVPDYIPPSSFALSPITSPAMNPQLQPGNTPRSTPRTAESSIVESPRSDRLDLDGDVAIQEDRPRKSRKKAPATRASTASTRTRKNAAANARGKGRLSVDIPSRGAGGLRSTKSLAAKDNAEARNSISAPHSTGSGTSSISPGPAHDVVMAPPPKPGSATSTPTQAGQQNAEMQTPNAATPGSMMKDKGSGKIGSGRVNTADGPKGLQKSSSTSMLESGMEFLSLPEPAAPVVHAPNNNDLGSGSAKPTVRPQLADLNTASESPRPDSALASPSGPTGMQKGGRGSKKRNSSGSNLVSPALRPKMSPGVKPLLPGGSGMDSQTQALLIASRSNYENIINNNHLPGVSYPAELGANLTSKRTSHKLAEQGRRNRINDALKQMQVMLPPSYASKVKDAENSGSGNDKASRASAAVQSGNSKAATVENAIEYMRAMQQDAEQKEREIKQLRDELASFKSQTKASEDSGQ